MTCSWVLAPFHGAVQRLSERKCFAFDSFSYNKCNITRLSGKCKNFVALVYFFAGRTHVLPVIVQNKFAEKHLAKGKKICIAGHIETGSYTNKNGERVYTTEVVVEQHEFLEPRKQDKPIEMPPQDDGFMDVPDGLEDEGLPFN